MAEVTKFSKLMRTLLDRTRSGQATWVVGSRDGTFIWSSKSGSITVFPTDHDDRAPWSVMILDSSGQTLEEESFGGGDAYFDLAFELYRAARSNALDIDSTIDKLLSDLG